MTGYNLESSQMWFWVLKESDLCNRCVQDDTEATQAHFFIEKNATWWQKCQLPADNWQSIDSPQWENSIATRIFTYHNLKIVYWIGGFKNVQKRHLMAEKLVAGFNNMTPFQYRHLMF